MSYNPTSTFDAIIYRPGGTSGSDVKATWAEVKTFIQASSNGKCIVYVDDSIVSPALVNAATGTTDCKGRVEIRPALSNALNPVFLQIENGATLRDVYAIIGSIEVDGDAQGATPSFSFSASAGEIVLLDGGAMGNALTATAPIVSITPGSEFAAYLNRGNVFQNAAAPLIDVPAGATFAIVALSASGINANIVQGAGTYFFSYDNTTAFVSFPAGTPPTNVSFTGVTTVKNLDVIWAQKPIDPTTFNAPPLHSVPVFDGTAWQATSVPSGSVTGTPNTVAYFNAAGVLTETPTFLTAIDATGFLLVGATTTDNGSSARLQNTSLVANGSQFRSNQYGNNAGIPGLTAFKSRGAAVGTLAGLLAGDPIQRFTGIGVAPDNASIPLASFITVQVPANFVPAGQNWLPTELEVQLTPLAGPINSHRVVYKITSEGETQTLRGIRAGGPSTLPTNLTVGTLWSSDAMNPNGSIVGSPGDLFSDTAGGAGATLWVKETGVATNTGWVAASGSGGALTGNTNGPAGANRFLSLVNVVVDADFAVTEVEGWTYVGMTALTASRTVTLPAVPTEGEVVVVTDETDSLINFDITIDGNGQNVQGAATYVMSVAQNGLGGSVALQYDGTAWFIFAAFSSGIRKQVFSGPLVSSVQLQCQDMIVFVDTTLGAVNLTLPTPAGVPFRLTFRDSAGTFNTQNLTLTPPGAVNINGANTPLVIAAQYPHIVAETDGANYFV